MRRRLPILVAVIALFTRRRRRRRAPGAAHCRRSSKPYEPPSPGTTNRSDGHSRRLLRCQPLKANRSPPGRWGSTTSTRPCSAPASTRAAPGDPALPPRARTARASWSASSTSRSMRTRTWRGTASDRPSVFGRAFDGPMLGHAPGGCRSTTTFTSGSPRPTRPACSPSGTRRSAARRGTGQPSSGPTSGSDR